MLKETSIIPLEGSFITKIGIFYTFITIFVSEISILFLGVGKEAAFMVTEQFGDDELGYTVGHTIPGIIIEQGMLYLFDFSTCSYIYKKDIKYYFGLTFY